MVLSFVVGDVMPQVFDELHEGFFNDVGERTVVFLGQALQMLAEPFFAFLREINV
jgi:hypothetical protein